jgi:hypothetical protein
MKMIRKTCITLLKCLVLSQEFQKNCFCLHQVVKINNASGANTLRLSSSLADVQQLQASSKLDIVVQVCTLNLIFCDISYKSSFFAH